MDKVEVQGVCKNGDGKVGRTSGETAPKVTAVPPILPTAGRVRIAPVRPGAPICRNPTCSVGTLKLTRHPQYRGRGLWRLAVCILCSVPASASAFPPERRFDFSMWSLSVRPRWHSVIHKLSFNVVPKLPSGTGSCRWVTR